MSTSDAAEPAGEPVPCPPCRGTGTVISNLGGSPSELPCPWCEGSGVLNPAGDAQAHWRAGQAAGEPGRAPDLSAG